jgi:hypothetical protein
VVSGRRSVVRPGRRVMSTTQFMPGGTGQWSVVRPGRRVMSTTQFTPGGTGQWSVVGGQWSDQAGGS